MSCTITVSGKDSEKFNVLSSEFGGRAALESILDSDGTSTIDGFLSDVEQSNRVNAVAYHVLDYLRSIDAVTSLDMSPEMLSEDNIKVALEAARNNFVSIIQDNLSENMSEEEKRVASRAYVAYRNFSELVPKVIRKFENFGLTIAEVNNDMDHISDMEESETSDKQHIYSQSNLERNPLDSVSPSVKLFFSARPRKVFDASGEVVNAIDDLGMAVPVDFHDLYSKVMKNLTDISTYEEMEAKLEELAEVDPDIKGLVEDLQDAKFDKRGVTINGIKSTPLKNAFFTAMNNTQYDHLSVIIDVDRYAEEPGVKKVSLLEPNRRNLSKSLRNEWASNVTKLMKLPKAQKVELWEKRVEKVFDPSSSFNDISLKKERKKAFDKQLADPKSKVALVNVANMLELIGIRVSPEAVNVLRTKLNREESGGFAKFVNSKLYNLGKNFYTGDTNIFESEVTTLTLLSDAQANLKGELGNRSFLNGEGNLVFPINKPTFAKEWFSEMQNKGKLFEDLTNDPFYGESKIVKDFIEEYDIQMRSFDTITDNTTNSVIPFSDLDPVTSLATRYNLFMNYNSKGILAKVDSRYGWFMVPTPADRTGTQVFKMRLLGKGKFVDKFNVFSEESGYKEWAVNSAKAEFERIATVREEYQSFKDNTSELVENYHYIGNELGNGGYFQYFPELNQFLKEEDGALQDIDFSSPEVLSALETAIQNQIAEDIKYLQEIGFLENDSSPKLSKQAKKFVKAPHFDESSLYKFLLNSYVANQELSSLMYGDIAHFKGNRVELESGDILSQTNLANANKRAGLAFTPGSKLRVGNGGVKATFEVAFVNDVINNLESDVYDSIAESIPKNQAEKFKKTNSTDGQGLAMLDRYAELLNGQGLLTPAMQTTLEELKKDNPDWNKVTEKLVPVKGFYHSNEFDGEFNRVMPKNLKYSLLPVFPSMMKNNPKLQEMYKKMLDSKVDELVFVSGSKMGAYNVNNAEDAIYKTVTLNNNRYRIPQVVPYKSKVMENFGSQMRKLIESNLVKDGDYNGKSGSQLRDDYNAAISLKIQNAFRDMIEGFISDGHIDIEKVAKRVLDEIENNKYRSDSDFINKALEIIETETGKDTRVPMSFPAIKYKVESVLNSMAKKAVNRLSLPGFVGVVYTSYGMNNGEIAVDKTLKFVRKDKNGNVLPAQVKMSPQYFLGVLRDKTKKLTNDLARTKNDEVKVQIQEEIKDINSVISKLVSGTFDITKMPAHVRQGVIYRIPTQGKNSMLPIEVVEFTPEAFSTSITLPAAIVTQSGMDYDIDKVYVELKHTSYSNGQFYTATPTLNTREGIDNTIVQTHYDVLTSPAHFSELITPNNTDTLEKLVDEIAEIYEVNRVGSKWSSVSTQDGFRDKNQAGGVFIGIASNANTAHALYQSLGVTLDPNNSEVKEPTTKINIYAGTNENSENIVKQAIRDVYQKTKTSGQQPINAVEPYKSKNRLEQNGNHVYEYLGLPYTIKKEEFKQFSQEDIKNFTKQLPIEKFGTSKLRARIEDLIDNYLYNKIHTLVTFLKEEYGMDFKELDSILDIIKAGDAELKALNIALPQNHIEAARYIELLNYYNNTVKHVLDAVAEKFNVEKIELTGYGENNVYIPNRILHRNTTIEKLEAVEQSETTEPINIYAGTGENSELSNFAYRPFVSEAVSQSFDSVEQAFQWSKAKEAGDETTADSILKSKSSSEIKRLGGQVKGLNVKEWDKSAYSIMKDFVYESFAQNPEAAQKLLDTGNSILTHTQDRSRWGKDFPEILMAVREEVQENSRTANTPKANIPQNLVSGVEAYGTRQEANSEAKRLLGNTPHSIDMIEAGIRTRTTRSSKEMEKYDIKVGDVVNQFGKSADGTTKNILTRVTAIHYKGTPGFLGTWEKEGWTSEGVKAIDRYKKGAAAIEFEILKETSIAQEGSQETSATGVTVNGKAVRSLSLVHNDLGGLISDDHIEIQTAAVDNASNPLLGHLNINTVTGSTFLFLVESGAGLNYSVRLLNTPIIRELVRRTRINEATMGKEGAYQDALSSLAKDRKFNMEYVNKNDYDVSMSDIDNAINLARRGEMVSNHDFDILRAFTTFKRYGDNLVTFQSAMRHDVKGTRQTIAANVLATNKLARIDGTYSAENYKGHYIDSYVPVFFDKDKYNKHSIKAFEEYGLHKPIQLAGLFIADSSNTFRALLDRVSDDLGNMSDNDARLLMTDFYTYLFANQAPHADLNTRSVISETAPETTLELMVGQNSVAKKLIAAKLKEHARAKEDLSYIPNMLLSSLSAELDNRQTGTDVVSFNNSISRALTSDQKSLLSNEFYELLVHEDPFYRSLALELFALNFFTEGFSRGINSYSEFIPIEIYEHFKGESGKSMVDYFRDLWQDFQDPKKFNISDFVFKFYANRGQELSGIRDLTNMSESKLKSYLTKNPKVKVFLAKTKGKTAIGSRIPESNDYSIITETMGTKGWRVDYQGFGEVSKALSSMQALKVEEAKSNVEQKNC